MLSPQGFLRGSPNSVDILNQPLRLLVFAEDGKGGSASQVLKVSVLSQAVSGKGPESKPIPSQMTTEGDLFSLDISSHFIDKEAPGQSIASLRLTMTGAPEGTGLYLDAGNGFIHGSALRADVIKAEDNGGALELTIVAADRQGRTVQETFRLYIKSIVPNFFQFPKPSFDVLEAPAVALGVLPGDNLFFDDDTEDWTHLGATYLDQNSDITDNEGEVPWWLEDDGPVVVVPPDLDYVPSNSFSSTPMSDDGFHPLDDFDDGGPIVVVPVSKPSQSPGETDHKAPRGGSRDSNSQVTDEWPLPPPPLVVVPSVILDQESNLWTDAFSEVLSPNKSSSIPGLTSTLQPINTESDADIESKTVLCLNSILWKGAPTHRVKTVPKHCLLLTLVLDSSRCRLLHAAHSF